MNQTDLEILSHFEEIWSRVRKGNESISPRSECDVETMMTLLWEYMWGCLRLGQRICGEPRRQLSEMHHQLKKRYARLQLRWFLRTGDIHFAGNEMNFASYTPYNLRKLWQTNVQNTEMAEKCKLHEDMEFAEEIQEMKEEVLRQRAILEDLIGKCLR